MQPLRFLRPWFYILVTACKAGMYNAFLQRNNRQAMVDVLIYRLNYTQASVTVQKSITWLEHQFWQWSKFGSLEQDSLAWYNAHINLFVLEILVMIAYSTYI